MTRFWVGDRLVDPIDATVSVLDHGLTVGDGAFETLLVRDGVPFAITRHLGRLERSLEGLGVPAVPQLLLRDAVDAVVADAGDDARRARLRITVTSGDGPFGSERGTGTPTLVVTLTPASSSRRHRDHSDSPLPNRALQPMVTESCPHSRARFGAHD